MFRPELIFRDARRLKIHKVLVNSRVVDEVQAIGAPCSIKPAPHQAQGIGPVLDQCWASGEDGGLTLVQHMRNVLYLL